MNFRGGSMGGMNELMRQAARMQRKLEQTKEELKNTEVEEASLGGQVKVTATYGRRLSRVEVDPDTWTTEDREIVLAAVAAAANAALEKADKGMEAELEKRSLNLKIPGT